MKRIYSRSRLMPKAEINITNLVDVTMTLLITFMIVTPLLNQGLEIKLPESRVTENLQSPDKVILVECDDSGFVQINRNEVVLGDVEKTIKELLGQLGPLTVQVRADKDLSVGHFMGLCGEIQAAGPKSIDVETDKSKIEF